MNLLRNLRLAMGLDKVNIGIVDYGIGNLESVYNFLKKINTKPIISREPDILMKADMLILPGVGTFQAAMKNITNYGLKDYIKSIKDKKILGICLGAQIFFEKSFEGGEFNGLNLIPGKVVPMTNGANTGWDEIRGVSLKNIFEKKNSHFYFNHSFKIDCDDKYVVAYTLNSKEKIPSIITKDNLFGFQFHPEKSQLDGELLIKGIIKI